MVKTRRKQKGRGFVSKGSFGCVYRPPLKCQGNTQRKTNGISKLMYETQADLEYKATQILETIDPQKDYFLSATRVCKPDTPEASNGVDASTCDLLKNPPIARGANLTQETEISSNLSNAKIVEYPDGGENLDYFRPNVNNFYQYFKGFETLLEGLVKLHAAGYAHLDIKAANVVAKRLPMPFQGEQEIQMRFIDFGFLTNAEKFFSLLSDSQRRSAYTLWPHDIYFTLGCSHNDYFIKNMNLYNAFLLKYFNNVKNFAKSGSYYTLPMPFIKNLDDLNYKKIQVLYKKYHELSPNETEQVKVLLPTIDIFMLGVLLSTQYVRFLLQFQLLDGTIQLTSALQLSPSQEAWFTTVSNHVSLPLFTLLNKMLDIDFTKRISAADALAEYKPILDQMKIHFTEQHIQDNIKPFRPLNNTDLRPPSQSQPGGSRQRRKTHKKKSSNK